MDLLEIIEKLKKENSELKLKYNQALLKIKSIEGQEAMDRVSTSLNEMVSNQEGLRKMGVGAMKQKQPYQLLIIQKPLTQEKFLKAMRFNQGIR